MATSNGFMARWVVAARWPIVALWIAAVVLAIVYLPSLGSGTAAMDDLVPSDSRALATQARSAALFGAPSGSDTAVVERRAGGLRAGDVVAGARLAVAASTGPGHRPSSLRGVLPLVNESLPGVRWREQGTTAISALMFDPGVALTARRSVAAAYARRLRPAPGVAAGVTGAAPARLAEFGHIEDLLPWVTAATIAVVVLMSILYFRSLGAPLLTLATAGIGYVAAVRSAGWLSQRAGIDVPREIQPVLVVLLLGLATDYGIFLMADARRAMLAGADRCDAARDALSRTGPSVLTAGSIVAASSAALLVGHLDFFRAFGPGLAICALAVTLVAVTFVPAVLAIAGPLLFGRTVRAAEGTTDVLSPVRAGRVARLLTARPAALLVVLVVAGGLVAAGAQARRIHLGVDAVGALPPHDPVRVAGAAAQRGFAGGILGPTDVIVAAPAVATRTAALERLRTSIAREPGVAAAVGPGAGRVLAALTRTRDPMTSRDGRAARIVVVFDDAAASARGLADLRRLRAALPALAHDAGLPPASIAFAGESALGLEQVDAIRHDIVRIAVAIAAVTFVLLAIFLRALVAPLLLLAASCLGFAASLGLTALVVRSVAGDEEITYFVPLVAGVLLVALGSDYTVLVAGRVRDEAGRRRTRDAIAVAVPQASRAITMAGVTLASTFALLALVPVRPFRELALLLCVGVLVDVLLVRSVLVPGMLALAGNGAWWPTGSGRALARTR